MEEMRTNEEAARKATGHNALVVQGYFDQLKREIEEYWKERYKLTPDQQARIEARKKAEEDRRNALTPAQRATEDKAKEKELKKFLKRKGPRGRNIPQGSGTNAGYRAGDRVQLRKEVSR